MLQSCQNKQKTPDTSKFVVQCSVCFLVYRRVVKILEKYPFGYYFGIKLVNFDILRDLTFLGFSTTCIFQEISILQNPTIIKQTRDHVFPVLLYYAGNQMQKTLQPYLTDVIVFRMTSNFVKNDGFSLKFTFY